MFSGLSNMVAICHMCFLVSKYGQQNQGTELLVLLISVYLFLKIFIWEEEGEELQRYR